LSRKFLTPINLPHGTTLPSVGSSGDLFYKTDEQTVYVHTSTRWIAAQGGGSGGYLSSLYDVSITAPIEGDILLYNSADSTWQNTSLADILYGPVSTAWMSQVMTNVLIETGLLNGDSGLYNAQPTGTIDGGTPTTSYLITYDGGNESSF
jgi:hypothetical protein